MVCLNHSWHPSGQHQVSNIPRTMKGISSRLFFWLLALTWSKRKNAAEFRATLPYNRPRICYKHEFHLCWWKHSSHRKQSTLTVSQSKCMPAASQKSQNLETLQMSSRAYLQSQARPAPALHPAPSRLPAIRRFLCCKPQIGSWLPGTVNLPKTGLGGKQKLEPCESRLHVVSFPLSLEAASFSKSAASGATRGAISAPHNQPIAPSA